MMETPRLALPSIRFFALSPLVISPRGRIAARVEPKRARQPPACPSCRCLGGAPAYFTEANIEDLRLQFRQFAGQAEARLREFVAGALKEQTVEVKIVEGSPE